MSIRASNNVFPHDPDDNWRLKLDRSGYEGTAQDLKNEIDSFVSPDTILISGEITKVGSLVSILQNAFTCRIDGSVLTNIENYSTTINNAADNYKRIDILVFTKYGTIVKIQGPESVDSVEFPQTPPDTLFLTSVPVYGNQIGNPTPPLTGDEFVKKSESQNILLTGSGEINILTMTDERTSIVFAGAITQLNTIQYPWEVAKIYNGKIVTLYNRQPTNVIIPHASSGGSVDFNFPDGKDFVLKPNQVISFFFDLSYYPYAHHMFIGIDLSDYYTKTEIDSKISSVLIYKGSVPNYASLPSTGLAIGHVYNLSDTGHNYAWTGTVWDDLGPAVDISGKEDISNKTQDIETNKTSTTKYASVKQLYDWAVAKFQSVLVSGTNIKTVNGNSLLGSGNIVIASPIKRSIHTFYPSWTLAASNTWKTWGRNTSNILVVDANQSLGTATTPTTFGDSNFIAIVDCTTLSKLTFSLREPALVSGISLEIFVQKFDYINGTGRGSELNPVTIIQETFTLSNLSNMTMKNNFTIAAHTLSANSGLFIAYRSSNSTATIQGVQLVFDFI